MCFCFSHTAEAQVWLSEVKWEPDTPIACRSTEVKIEGWLPATNYAVDSSSVSITGDSIKIFINAGYAGFGFPGIIPFDHFEEIAAIPKGIYTMEVNYSLDGSLVDQYVDAFVVKTCCKGEPENLLYVVETDGFILKWNPIPYSQVCRVRGKVPGVSGWITGPPILAEEPDKFFIPDNRINSGMMYEWQVRCACSLSPLTGTGWSESAFFFVP